MSNFKSGACPITNVRMPNRTMAFRGFHLSYNASSGDYGSDTTAIVLADRVFFLLNGDHQKPLSEAAVKDGIQGCVDYFIANIDKANRLSEHYIVIGNAEDVFSLIPTTLDVIGKLNIERISQACNLPVCAC